jgi:hypothetical protein
MAADSLFDNVTLTPHPHRQDQGISTKELLSLVTTGILADKTPQSLTVCCEVLSGIEEAPWRDDAHRTAVLVPYLRKLVSCTRNHDADLRRACGLADYACRTLLPEFLDTIGKGRVAIQLRALPRITDAASAQVAAKTVGTPTIYIDDRTIKRGARILIEDAVRNACRAAVSAAGEAARGDPGRAAYDAGIAALWVARAARYAHATPLFFWVSIARTGMHASTDPAGLAASGAAIERNARAMLDIILEMH